MTDYDNNLIEAIATIEKARETHISWAEWQESDPDWRDQITPNDPGNPEHHRDWIRKYDQVLNVLRQQSTYEAECICPRFKDTGGVRIADLACPIHGVEGTEPGDGMWDDDK